MDKEELKAYLVEEAEYDLKEVERMSPRSLVEAWLNYQGIIGYTEQILDVVDAAYEIDIESSAELSKNFG